jgi:hypothetical protein
LGIDAFQPSQETWKHHFLGIAMLQRPREKNKTLICRFPVKVAQKFMFSLHDQCEWPSEMDISLWLLAQKSFNLFGTRFHSWSPWSYT